MLCSTLPRPANNTAVQKYRKAHRKVKTGCVPCKIRRQKCGEEKPECAHCIRYSTQCVYKPSDKVGQKQSQQARSHLSAASVNIVTQPPIPRSTPPLPPSQDLNLQDLELLHQYLTSTSVAPAQVPDATIQVQMAVPRLAQTHPFVMRGILAQAAIHLSWLRPSEKRHYTMLATKHHSLALPDFRSALKSMEENNHQALVLFSKGLVWCSFAWYETLSGQEETASRGTKINWLPSWFHLLRGSCLIVEFCKPWIKSGLHLLPPPLDDLTEFSSSLDNRRISALASQLLPLIECPTCETVLSALRVAFARASIQHHNTPLRNAMNFWVGVLPNEYLNELQRGDPGALVILGHFCILVYRSETRWFMRGHAIELLRSIDERLAGPWKQHLQWPFEEVGFWVDSAALSVAS